MYLDLINKIAVVTGAGKKGGIGFAIAEKLAECKANVVITDVVKKDNDANNLIGGQQDEMVSLAQELSKQFNIEAQFVELDVTSTASVDQFAETIKTRFGRVDILCNNAGTVLGVPNAVHTYDENAWLKTIDVNLNGVFRVSKAIVPLMMGQAGSIVNVASRAAKVPPLFNGAYAVSKAGVMMMTKVMAKELAGAGIRVNAICPGVIATDFTDWRFRLEADVLNSTVEEREAEMVKTIPMGRIGDAGEVANLVVFLSSNQSSYTTGQAINVTGGQLMEI